jgi:membrane protease YdiL (CAAX protease family)
MIIEAFLAFVRDPLYRKDPNTSPSYIIHTTFRLLVWALGIGLLLAILLGLLETAGPWKFGDHAFNELLEQYPVSLILLLLVVVAPVLEELIFRGPLWFFRGSLFFKWYFYGTALVFGLVHLSNFPNLSEIWYLFPLLICPQLCLGLFLGYVRVRFGLAWAILFHAAYNGILAGPALLLVESGIPTP